ncbi:MAG: tRNA pseudouridine(13) synthase TruD [Deltaproteobacteria bacterium]|nr:tRNA pseudouridine(13) synthase TruD [Deltaproteobacteria bacterium]
MIVKLYPEDFFVKELLDLPISTGPYSYYLLKKKNVNFFHVLDIISQKWKISRERFGYCGIKDKRALTEQYISIKYGPAEGIKGKGFALFFLGKGDKPLRIGDAYGNLFRVTLRRVDPKRISKSIQIVGEIGFANYFGKQRFTPDLYSSRPIARLLLEGKFEEALKEYFLGHYSSKVRQMLEMSPDKLLDFVSGIKGLSKMDKVVLKRFAKKKDAEYALRAYPKAIKLMFFFSYQSVIWNRILNEIINENAETFTVRITRRHKVSFYKSITSHLNAILNLELPYVSEEIYSLSDRYIRQKIIKWVEKENLEPHINKEIIGLKPFLAGKRKIVAFPYEAKMLDYTRNTCVLEFSLPSGSYGTVFLLKVLNYPL